MKKLLVCIVAVICLSGFRAPNGNLISKGDYVDKLLYNLGEPLSRIHIGTIHRKTYFGIESITREIRWYKINQYNYRFIIENNRIVADHWTRF